MRTAMGDRVLIMEVRLDHAVVMLPGGGFRRVRVPRGEAWSVGQEVWLPAPNRRPLVWGAAAVLVLVALVVPLERSPGTVEAAGVVSLDINPSINLVVDKSGRVLRYQALDTEAQQLIKIAPPTGKDLARAVQDLTLAAQAKGYLNPASQQPVDILLGNVASPAQNPIWFQQAVSAEQQLVSQHHWNAKVYTASAANQQLAQQLAKGTSHISVGRYLLWEEAKRHVPATLSLPQAASAALPGLLQKAVSSVATVTAPHPSATASPSPSGTDVPSRSRPEQRHAGEGAQGAKGHIRTRPTAHHHSPAPSSATETVTPKISLLPSLSKDVRHHEHAKSRSKDKKSSHRSRHSAPRPSGGVNRLQLPTWLQRLTGSVGRTLDQ